ncbi:MAG: hypothetical protein S4CHLAM45_09780 [Chlamydiales bacterium]|nr:hypothetical protein [Chlamydiales bacterium]MCH9620204.1 hypothetical protein [Chlamydiales bacterium]MCH9623081.1 hypothetical protein [Chlamydiales bacterium]
MDPSLASVTGSFGTLSVSPDNSYLLEGWVNEDTSSEEIDAMLRRGYSFLIPQDILEFVLVECQIPLTYQTFLNLVESGAKVSPRTFDMLDVSPDAYLIIKCLFSLNVFPVGGFENLSMDERPFTYFFSRLHLEESPDSIEKICGFIRESETISAAVINIAIDRDIPERCLAALYDKRGSLPLSAALQLQCKGVKIHHCLEKAHPFVKCLFENRNDFDEEELASILSEGEKVTTEMLCMAVTAGVSDGMMDWLIHVREGRPGPDAFYRLFSSSLERSYQKELFMGTVKTEEG